MAENKTPGELTTEQQFKLKVLSNQAKSLSLEQAQEYVVEVTRQMLVKDNLVKHMLRSPND